MPFTLNIQNYRALRQIEWSPQGVCALVGPNGAGKSTLLGVLQLLRHTFEYGLLRALNHHGGVEGALHFDAAPDEFVNFTLRSQDAYWTTKFSPHLFSMAGLISEELVDNQRSIAQRGIGSASVTLAGSQIPDDGRSLLRIAADAFKLTSGLDTLRQFVQSYRCYAEYHLAHVRESGSAITSDKTLDVHGRNVFSVLRNWRDTRADRSRHDFVIGSLCKLFPDVFLDMDYETAGTAVTGRVVTSKPDISHPIAFAPNGLLVALLHLCAVASVPNGGIVAIDEVENSLHPFAIKHLIEAFRTWAAKTNSTVLLATHSPVVLDQFRECPEQVFVMEKGQATNPMPLPKVRDPEYLSHFSLGDLYAHLEFGSPVGPQQS